MNATTNNLLRDDNGAVRGYIIDFKYGAYEPDGKVEGVTPEEQIEAHNKELAVLELEAVKQRGKGVFYISPNEHESGYKVSQWCGGFTTKPWEVKKSFHNFAGNNGRLDCWFALDGSVWHGVNIGDNQMLRIKRTNKKA